MGGQRNEGDLEEWCEMPKESITIKDNLRREYVHAENRRE